MTMKHLLAFAALTAAAAVAGVPAMAQSYALPSKVKTGYLTCQEARGWGLVFGSTRDLKCVYTSTAGKAERYTGNIDKFGVDIGYVSGGVVVWAVLSPTSDVGKGALAGSYVGVTAGATLAAGGGANLLVGGSDHSISLQPLSVEGTTGLNVAAGVAGIILKPVAS